MHIARLRQDNCESGRYWNRNMDVYVFFDLKVYKTDTLDTETV